MAEVEVLALEHTSLGPWVGFNYETLNCRRVEGYLLALQILGCIDTSLMSISMHLKFAWYGSYWGLDWYETGIITGHTSLISSLVLSFFYTRPSLMIQNQEQHNQFALML